MFFLGTDIPLVVRIAPLGGRLSRIQPVTPADLAPRSRRIRIPGPIVGLPEPGPVVIVGRSPGSTD